MNKFTISIFPNKSKEGIELAIAMVQLIGRKVGVQFCCSDFVSFESEDFRKAKNALFKEGIDLTVYNRFTNSIGQWEFLNSCLNDDLIILDATREGENNSVNNFDIANEHPKSLDRIWVVSRNYLPINFYGVDNGGYPDYKTATKSNEELIDWVSNKLLKIDFSMPGDPAEKGMEGWHRAAERTINRSYCEKNKATNIFISFRTRYQYQSTIMLQKESFYYIEKSIPSDIHSKLRRLSNKAFDGQTDDFKEAIKSIWPNISEEYYNLILKEAKRFDISAYGNYQYPVKDLAIRIKEGKYHRGESKTVKYLEDGSLVYATELNTKQRTWQLLSIIDREYIMHCDELWIYGSDDYLDSWWTKGELLIYAFLLHQNIDKRAKDTPRKLMLYNPYNDAVKEIKSIDINDAIAKRITRIQSNCAPGVMGYESVKTLRIMRNLLYGNDEQSKKSFDEYFGLLMQSVIPLSLKEQGMDDKTIDYILSHEEAVNEVKAMFHAQFEVLKTQLKTGNIDEEMKRYFQSMLSIQNELMPENMQNVVSEADVLSGFSEEYLKDEVFSEDFWETLIYQQPIQGIAKPIEENLKEFEKTIHQLLDFSNPQHIIIGNIKDIASGKIVKLDNRNIIRKSSRFLFMPSRAGSIDLSPSKNNLQELPVVIVEN